MKFILALIMCVVLFFLFALCGCEDYQAKADAELQAAQTTCLNSCARGVAKLSTHYGDVQCECK